MKSKLKGLVIIFSLLTLQANAQEKKTLTLNDAIDLGIQNSKQLKNSQAKIEEATAALKEAAEKELPDVKVSGSYLRLNSANFDLKTKNNNSGGSTIEAPKVNQAMYGIVNASLPIYSGGRIRYGIESSRFLAEAAKLDADHEQGQVIINTTEAYVNLY